jgi:hypothetical protein
MTDNSPLRGLQPDRRDPRAAWLHFRRTLDADATARVIILNLAGTREGRHALDESRRAWARHGLPAPFDALLREELGEETEDAPGAARCAGCGGPLLITDLGADRCAGCRLLERT